MNSLLPTHTYFSKKQNKTKQKPPKPEKQMVSPLQQSVTSSQVSGLSNKSQKNSDYNGKADRHLTLMVQTEGTQENTLVRLPTLSTDRSLMYC